uniref:Mitochondrial chaperone BCS1 n=1 Tax=Coccolithus braarudii TaxID=221442 RepID=A0A7S0Q794_9EUKA
MLGTGLAFLRGAGKAASTMAQRHLLVTLEVTSKDRAYPWVLHWLTEQARSSGSTAGAVAQHVTVDTISRRLASGKMVTHFEFTPCPGRHVMRYNGQLLMIDRVREQQTVDLSTGQPWESVKLTALGRTRSVFEEFLQDARDFATSKQEQTTTIYSNWGTEWRPFGPPRRRRPLHSVVLDQGIAEHLRDDVGEFLDSSKWYADRGIPYRRGYLLHGPPGSGKSSFVASLAGAIGHDICVLNLSEAGLTDDRLAHALTLAPPQSLVLLEDIDAAFIERDPRDRRSAFVTFSGLLNALDGVAAGEERLVFMTTNHIERLDPALIRPGRIDVIHEISNATPYQMRQLFLNFFPEDQELAERFVEAMDGANTSMALLQSFFMLNRHSASQAIEQAPEFMAGLREARGPMQQRMSEAVVGNSLRSK